MSLQIFSSAPLEWLLTSSCRGRGSRGDKEVALISVLREILTEADGEYEGQYVAIVGRSIVAHGKDAKRVYEIAREKYSHDRVLIGQVRVKEVMARPENLNRLHQFI